MSGGRVARALVPALAGLLLATMLTGCSDGGSITLTASFDDVGDLVEGHSVQIADVRIGRIDEIRLGRDFRAQVTMSIDPEQRVPVRSTAVLRTTSLLGEKFIELRPLGKPTDGPFLRDGDAIRRTAEAPELEFVAEQAIQVFGAITGNDLATMIETGAVGFGGRGADLRGIIGDLSVVSRTLAERSADIARIVDRLDEASGVLASGNESLDALLVNLADATTALADNRQRAVDALAELTRLARVQNEEVFRPHFAAVDRQLEQLDAVVGEVAAASVALGRMIDWLERFAGTVPKGIPNDFAQVYGWFVQEDDRSPEAGP